MHGAELRDCTGDRAFVKNGMNPATAYTQVHYLKGFFLLRYLGSML
jgi:hypothetical protein